MSVEIEYDGVKFAVKQQPATVFFFEDGIIVDHVSFTDVQEACEYLGFCRYRKDKREEGLWYKDNGQEALIMYTEVKGD